MGKFETEKTESQFIVKWQVLLAGKGHLVLNEDGLESLWAGLLGNQENRVSLAEVRLFEKAVRHKRKGRDSYYLRAVCQGKNIELSSPTGGSELDDLCASLNAFLVKLKTAAWPTPWDGIPEPIVLEIDSAPQRLEPPPKCRWRYQPEFDGFSFRKRGGDSKEEILVYCFIALVCGILGGVFAFLDDKMAFVAPICALLVLIFLVLAFYKLIEFFFRKTSWTFARGEARFRTVLFLRARTANHELTGWSSLAAQIIEAERNYAQELKLDCDPKKVRNYYDGESRWQLVFLNAAREQLAVIEKLSKPEALWMADVMLREQRAIR
ncbi:MAG: hypothetical protein FWD31_06945 [Planctomycetaceae bacterium]|nr:hypothetical protein [Planctomycetaceae bacterium]